MSMTVSISSELGKAIDRGENRIIVKGSLGGAVLVIEAIGPVAWVSQLVQLQSRLPVLLQR